MTQRTERPPGRPHDHYVDEFVRLPCAGDILRCGVFPNAKEISESMAAFEAVRRALIDTGRGSLLGDPEVVLYDVGSGRKPRTAALAAFRTRWTCVAIDPILDPTTAHWRRVARLRVEASGVESYVPAPDEVRKFAIVLGVHNHAGLTATIEALRLDERPGYCLVSIPCCVPHDIDPGWDAVHTDWGIKSQDRVVYVKSVLGKGESALPRSSPFSSSSGHSKGDG
jgi:hypothetical protein